MPTLYLHIGRGKTGTTLIQRHLSKNRSRLAEQGVHYVLADDAGTCGGHQQFAKSFITTPPRKMIPARDPDGVRLRVFEEINALGAETVLLSSENFAIASAADTVDFFRKLPIRYDIKIIYFVRSQDELAETEYDQVVKIGREMGTIHSYIDHEIEGCDFMAVAREWEAQVGQKNMICKIYDSAKRDVIGRFLSCIPEIQAGTLLKYEGKDALRDRNQAIGIRALSVARVLNSVNVEARVGTYERVFSTLLLDDLPALLLDSQQARRFRERFAESNFAFTERYMGAGIRDLGGRSYIDVERDRIRAAIRQLSLDFS